MARCRLTTMTQSRGYFQWRAEGIGPGAVALGIHRISMCKWVFNPNISFETQLWVFKEGGGRVGRPIKEFCRN